MKTHHGTFVLAGINVIGTMVGIAVHGPDWLIAFNAFCAGALLVVGNVEVNEEKNK